MFRLKSLKKRSFLVSRRAVKRVFEQAVFVRGLSVNLSLEASAVFDPFTIGIGVLQASVPDVILDASLLLQVSDLAPNPLHEWLLTDLNTLSVDLLTVTRIDGVVAPSLSGAAGDAAYGGLGIAYSDATLNGQYTYRANASIVATVSDILTGIADVVVQNSPDLASFETITFESLAESLTTAILGTEDWASTGDGAVATVGHTVEEFVSVRQQRIVSTINNSIAELRPSANATRLLVQDLPGLRWMALPIS